MSGAVSGRRNPVFGANRLKLGAFGFNGDYIPHTNVPERYVLSWENSLDVAEQADRAGFEAIVPYARWHSFVNPLHRSGHVYDNFTWTAAISALTRNSCVMSTCHIVSAHPLLAAKAAATIDHVSHGRFALNVVCGWYEPEMEMFGAALLDHDDRYAYADEWVTVLKRLWDEDGSFDFDGRFVTMRKAMSQPKPLQRPHPVLMNAGGSPQGQHFVAKHCDVAFVRTDTRDAMMAEIGAYRRLARERYGRDIQIWANCAIAQAATDADAERLVESYHQHADHALIDEEVTLRPRPLSPETLAALKRKFAASGPGLLLSGSATTIADGLKNLSSAGLDGVLLSWVDYQGGIRSFNAEVLPLLEEAGLRQPLAKTAVA